MCIVLKELSCYSIFFADFFVVVVVVVDVDVIIVIVVITVQCQQELLIWLKETQIQLMSLL